MAIAFAVHGGAWNVPDGDLDEHQAGIARVVTAGWRRLRDGDDAMDVVVEAIQMLEDDPLFNAGTGSHLNRLGRVELDASLMEGDRLEAGAVAAVERIKNPVHLARAVLEQSEHVLLVGDGALRFAADHGISECRARDLLVGRARDLYLRIRSGEHSLVDEEFAPAEPGPSPGHMGTVGAVARDAHGRIVAGTSTGGTLDKYPGRVGDSPLIGCGTYADSRIGGASCTGWGEGIIRVVMAKSAVDRMGDASPAAVAAAGALADLDRVGGKGGLILLDATGAAVAQFNTPRMARGLATETEGVRVGVEREMTLIEVPD